MRRSSTNVEADRLSSGISLVHVVYVHKNFLFLFLFLFVVCNLISSSRSYCRPFSLFSVFVGEIVICVFCYFCSIFLSKQANYYQLFAFCILVLRKKHFRPIWLVLFGISPGSHQERSFLNSLSQLKRIL